MLKKAERLNTPSWCTPGSFSSQSGDKVVPVMAARIRLRDCKADIISFFLGRKSKHSFEKRENLANLSSR